MTRANPYLISDEPDDHDRGVGPGADGDDSREIINVVYRTPWSTRVVSRIARAAMCLLIVLLVCGILGGVLPAFAGQTPPPWLMIALLVAPWPLAVMLYIALARRAPARIALREDVIQTGGWLIGRDIPYEDIRLLRVERPEKTVGRQSLLTLQVPDKSLVKVWLRSDDALECFDALRGLCAHAPAIGLAGETYDPLDAAHADAGRRTLASEYRRRAAWAMGTAVVIGAFALVHLVALLLGWNAGPGRSPPITRTIILSGVSIGALLSSLEQRRRARAIEAERAPGGNERIGATAPRSSGVV